MTFMKRENIDNFYKDLKKHYKDNKYKKFFNYFSRTWLGNRYPKIIWNYNNILNTENNIKYFQFTNDLTENINRFLNSNLKKSRCSNVLFRDTVLKIINRFENKAENISLDNKKSDILIFYLKNKLFKC